MLTLHLLGHTHLARAGQTLPVSRKAVALLTYLTLEGVPQHREALSELLWETASGLLNLRVELTRLRQQGLELFPTRQAMLSARLPTDLDAWQAGAERMGADRLGPWLALLRGAPLGGLEDLGSCAFQSWLDHQRGRLGDRLERQLAAVAGRLARQEQLSALGALRARADELGLSVPAPRPLPPVSGPWPEQTAAVAALIAQAHRAPQCLLLWGQPGSARALLSAAATRGDWHDIQLQYLSQRGHLLHALLRRLIGLRPAEERAGLEETMRTGDQERHLLLVGGLLTCLDRPVLLSLHDVYEAPEWLTHCLGLLMDLGAPLLIALSPTAEGTLGDASLAGVDWSRVHQLRLPPLGPADVLRRLTGADPESTGCLRSRATRIAQLSEGWPPYVEALLNDPSPTLRLPELLGTRVRLQLGHLDTQMRGGLAVLAQVPAQFSPAVVRGLLGEGGGRVLGTARALGVIGDAAPQDHVLWPSLSCARDDAESRLVFRSEVTRVALAASLPPDERQAVRARLAELLLESCPSVALSCAERAGRPDLAAQARAALPVLTPFLWRPAAAHPAAAPEWAALPPYQQVREGTTPNGYRLCMNPAWGLEVLRRGAPAASPRLTLCLGHVGPGPWTLLLRLDVFRSAPSLHLTEVPHAIGVQVGAGPHLVYAPQSTASATVPGSLIEAYSGLPLGQTTELSGQWSGPPGLLRLSFQAVDLACTVHALCWNGVDLMQGQARIETLRGHPDPAPARVIHYD